MLIATSNFRALRRPFESAQAAGERARIHRVSTVLNLEDLDAENQMRRAAAFLGGLFEAARDHWYPMLAREGRQSRENSFNLNENDRPTVTIT
jgi:hypothetical protein